MREHKYQEVLRRAKALRGMGLDVPVRISHEPDNPKDSKAIAVICCVDGNWHRIGYFVEEVLEEVHKAIKLNKILFVKFAWIRYIAEGTRSRPGYFAGINIGIGHILYYKQVVPSSFLFTAATVHNCNCIHYFLNSNRIPVV